MGEGWGWVRAEGGGRGRGVGEGDVRGGGDLSLKAQPKLQARGHFNLRPCNIILQFLTGNVWRDLFSLSFYLFTPSFKPIFSYCTVQYSGFGFPNHIQ